MDKEGINIDEILINNQDKNFIQRIIKPNRYPVIKNQDGTYSTHLMSSAEVDGKGIAYPING